MATHIVVGRPATFYVFKCRSAPVIYYRSPQRYFMGTDITENDVANTSDCQKRCR